jgi:predicted dienelactone hydrolase
LRVFTDDLYNNDDTGSIQRKAEAMKHKCWIAIGRAIFGATLCISSAVAMAKPYSVPPNDAPELAAIGPHGVGFRRFTWTNPNQPDIPKMVRTFGLAKESDRPLSFMVWYPAQTATGAQAMRYTAKLPGGAPDAPKAEFTHTGIAIENAEPVASQRFPLVIVSHGFGGWGSFMTYLTENLASKGYVVAAIEHEDAAFTDATGFGLSFGSTIVHRARDQQFALAQLLALASSATDPLGRSMDVANIGLIGYSMGGFGALATAGAGYDPTSATFRQIPGALMAPIVHGNPEFSATRPKNIQAVVLMAPWGGQSANRAWTPQALRAVTAPTLFVVGDQDDIVDYADGISYLFQNLKSTSRHLLVYQNARHNVGGNPAPEQARQSFGTYEYFEEPVWRKDRITAINQHFITAFLDAHLKRDKKKLAYLDVPTVKASDGVWSVAFGQSTGSAYAKGVDETAKHWRGFQRRWAVGLELHRKPAGE